MTRGPEGDGHRRPGQGIAGWPTHIKKTRSRSCCNAKLRLCPFSTKVGRYLQVASIAGRDAGLLLRRHASPPLDRRIPRKADDPSPAMTVAARAAHIAEGNADRRVGIAALHGQIEVDHRVAGVARDQ